MHSKRQSQTIIQLGLLLVLDLSIPTKAFGDNNNISTARRRNLQGILPHGVSDCSASFIEASLQTPVTTQATSSLYDHNVQAYCSNGGFCKAMYRDDPHNPCQCLEGFSGPHCEFFGSNVAKELSCTLDCQNEGVCMIGAETWEKLLQYDYDSTPQDQRQYCSCPNGHYGTLCEFGIKDSIAHKKCGDEPCLNGGVCKDKVNEDGSASRHCDCSGAKVLGVQHAGTYCEHNVTDVCTAGAYGSQVFCINGGTCKSDAQMGCDCPPGFVGPICEFKNLGVQRPYCMLTCFNKGICDKGSSDLSILEKYGLNNRQLVDPTQISPSATMSSMYNVNFEHCVCPIGYVGLQCEHQLDICPGGSHACMNGGECKTYSKDRTVEFECNCANAVSATTRYAGDFCERPATEFCTIDGHMPSTGPAVNAFCTNGGQCKGRIHITEQPPGCNCPDGFVGENCQFTASATEKPADREDHSSAAGTFTVVAFILLILFVLAILCRRRKRRFTQNSSNDEIIHKDVDLGDEPALSDHAMESNQIAFDNDNQKDSDNFSQASSKTGSTTSSKRNHLRKSRKKKFSTMDRTVIDFLDDGSTHTERCSDGTAGIMKTNQTPWPNIINNPTETASIFNEIDLGDDYGVNLVV